VRAPKKIRDVRPAYPELPPQTRASGIWIGDVLLDTKGKVSQVWAIREVQFTPPFPAFNRAIVDAIRQWEFEPLVFGKTPMPVCMTVTVHIDLR
jgi:outer membrane biosynthesis protein TonB